MCVKINVLYVQCTVYIFHKLLYKFPLVNKMLKNNAKIHIYSARHGTRGMIKYDVI